MKITYQQNIFIFAIIIFLCFFSAKADYKECHYSCLYCGSNHYSQCILCQDGFKMTAYKNRENTKLHYNHIQDYPWGTCIGAPSNINILGFILFFLVVGAFVWLKNRTIFYFLNTMQTFALLSLIQIGYLDHISYLLQSFEVFMFTSYLSKANKQYDNNLYESKRLRMLQFVREFDFKANFIPIFFFSFVCFILAALIPISRYFSRKEGSLWSICNCVNLQKIFNTIEITSIVCFIFLIQQCILMISVGLFLDDGFFDGGNVVLVIFYALIMALMIVNLCSKNFDFFPNKAGQQVEILKKCVLPPMVILPVSFNIAVAGFMFLLGLLGLFFNSTKGNLKTKTNFHQNLIKREFRYRLVELLILAIIIIYFFVQEYIRAFPASNALGIIAVLCIIAFILCFFTEIIFQLHGKYFLLQNQKLYKEGDENFSSMRPTKNIEQTLQNLQNTEQGLMEMVFFSRNTSPQKQKSIKKNIKLSQDIFEVSQNNMIQDKIANLSSNTSPTNRDNQRFKSKTARTPKNRSGRFNLNKAFEPGQQNDIQNVETKTTNLNQQMTHIQKSQRSQDLAPKTSRRTQGIKTVRQIKVQVLEDYDPKKSPRFGHNEQRQKPSPRLTQKQSPRFVQQQQLPKQSPKFKFNAQISAFNRQTNAVEQQSKTPRTSRTQANYLQPTKISRQQPQNYEQISDDQQKNHAIQQFEHNIQEEPNRQQNQQPQKDTSPNNNKANNKKKKKSKVARIYGGN